MVNLRRTDVHSWHSPTEKVGRVCDSNRGKVLDVRSVSTNICAGFHRTPSFRHIENAVKPIKKSTRSFWKSRLMKAQNRFHSLMVLRDLRHLIFSYDCKVDIYMNFFWAFRRVFSVWRPHGAGKRLISVETKRSANKLFGLNCLSRLRRRGRANKRWLHGICVCLSGLWRCGWRCCALLLINTTDFVCISRQRNLFHLRISFGDRPCAVGIGCTSPNAAGRLATLVWSATKTNAPQRQFKLNCCCLRASPYCLYLQQDKFWAKY